MAKTLAATVLVSSASNAAGATTRGRVDVSAVDGGILTYRITNGGTGPTVQCVARVLVAHKGASMPAAGSEGTGDLGWKRISEIGGGVVANSSTRGFLEFGPGYAYIEVEFTGNTGQGVTVEAHATTYTYP
jgi:hypothetical protein